MKGSKASRETRRHRDFPGTRVFPEGLKSLGLQTRSEDMKKTIVFLALGVGLIVNIGWLTQGCTGKVPSVAQVVATPMPTDVIDNFSNGENVNPSLCESQGGELLNGSYGASSVSIFQLVANPAISAAYPSDYAFHFSGSVTDSSAYPALILDILLSSPSSPYINATATGCNFSGIQFELNIMGDDTCAQRLFGVGTASTVNALPGGNCAPASLCGNDFWISGSNDYIGIPFEGKQGQGWQTYSYTWNQMSREGWGVDLNTCGPAACQTCTLSNCTPEEEQMMVLTFKSDGNDTNPGHVFVADYYVDAFQFLP